MLFDGLIHCDSMSIYFYYSFRTEDIIRSNIFILTCFFLLRRNYCKRLIILLFFFRW